MPRKSAASLSVVPTTPAQRPDPPEYLTADQATIWRAVVGTMPRDWFDPATWPLLIAFCRHAAAAGTTAKLIDQHQDLGTESGLRRYGRLLAMHERESKALAHLAVKMRLSHSARLRPEMKVERRTSATAPWEPKRAR